MLSIQKYTTLREKPDNYHSPVPLPSGSVVSLVKHNKSNTYYRYCYLLKEDAETALANIIKSVELCSRPDDIIEHNFYHDPEHTVHIINLNSGKEE